MNETTGQLIYERIRRIANVRKMSIKQVADKAGFKSRNAIYNYKYGAKPSEPTIQAIAKVLNTTPEYLKGETDDWQNHAISQEDNAVRPTDLTNPILALDGRTLAGDQAQKIRDFAKFLMYEEEKAEKEKGEKED